MFTVTSGGENERQIQTHERPPVIASKSLSGLCAQGDAQSHHDWAVVL